MILRTTFKDGQVMFEDLGDKFILTSKQRCPEKFDEAAKDMFGENESHPVNNMVKDCFAFLSPLRMDKFDIPLYVDMRYQLLSERGCYIMNISIGGL